MGTETRLFKKPLPAAEPTDSELVERARDGDDNAFGALVDRYGKLVYNVAYSKVGNADDAADVSQEIFLKAWRSLAGFRGDSSFSTWLCRIAVNASLDYIRKNRRTVTVSLTRADDEDDERPETDIADGSVEADPVAGAERTETVELVRRAIDALPPEAREIIVLRDMHGMAYSDIADVMGLELGTVKSRINRARTQIKEYLVSRGYVF